MRWLAKLTSANCCVDEHRLANGGARPQCKGCCTVNGRGNPGFQRIAIDDAGPAGGGVDKFRIGRGRL